MSDWSAAEDLKILRMWCAYEPPLTVRDIADDLGRTKSSVDRRIAALGLRGCQGDIDKYEEMTGVTLDPIIKPVTVERPVSPTGKVRNSNYTTLVWGDIHYPFQDPDAVSILYQITKALKPDQLMCIGDIFDFYELAPDYRSPMENEPDLMDALEQGAAHLSKMVELAEPNEAVFLAGNHEDRWDRMLDKARKDIRFRHLLRLPKIRRALEFEDVAGFVELGYSYYPYMEGGTYVANDRLVFTHGDRAPKHGAAAMISKYGKSVIFGHTHRIQNYTARNLKGQESAWNIGCLSRLDPHYDHFADWHHGFAIVTWYQAEDDWYYNVEQIRIHNGIAIFRDNVYVA